jgi:hypothetical protein
MWEYFVCHSPFGSTQLRTYLAVSFVTISFLISIASAVSAQAKRPDEKQGSVSFAWRVKISDVVGERPIGEIFGNEREFQAHEYLSMKFIDSNTVAVAYVFRELNTRLTHRDSSLSSSSLRLQIILVNATTGKAIEARSVVAASRRAGIVAVNEGRLVAQVEGKLVLYSAELQPIRDFSLPDSDKRGWQVVPSPTGKTLLVIPRDHGTGQWLVVDTNSLRLTGSWTDNLDGAVAVSDSSFAKVTCVWRHKCSPELQLRSLLSNWVPLPNVELQSHSSPQFVNDDVIFLSGHPSQFIQTDGTTLLADALPGSTCFWEAGISSSFGRRVIVPTCEIVESARGLDIGGTVELRAITIYDAPFDGRSYYFSYTGPKQKGLTYLAVSPSGHKLAVLNNGSLGIIDLPEPRPVN